MYHIYTLQLYLDNLFSALHYVINYISNITYVRVTYILAVLINIMQNLCFVLHISLI